MKLQVYGNVNEAIKELSKDKNNAVAYVYKNQVCQNSSGLLANATFTIKDIFATNDCKTTGSTKLLANFEPHYNATCVQRLIDAGAIKVAKVYCDELALGGTGTFSAFGLIRNPLDNTRLAGGSSSGSVATFTNNISFALASDTGDSVRLPASYNGVVGFKPSYGAISRYGMFAYASSLDTVSYFAHNVNDIVLVSQALFAKDNKDFTSKDVAIKEVKKQMPKSICILDVDYLTSPVKKAYQGLINKLQADKNIKVSVIKPNEDLFMAIKPIYDIISYSEASANLANLNGIAFGECKNGEKWEEIMTNTRSQGFGVMVQRRLTLGSFFLHSENQKELFLKAQKCRRLVKDYYEKLHNTYDIVIYPASADVAPYIDNKKNKNHKYMDYILTGANLAGNPSISIPWIKKDNLPVNLAIDAKRYEDQKLLSISLWMEEFLGGVHE